MKKLLNQARCRECKKVVEGDLRDHWMEEHLEKLEQIDRWLGKQEDRARTWEKVVRRQEGREDESK